VGLPGAYVLPFVIHHGDRPWRGPRSLGELVHFGDAGEPWRQFLAPLQLEQRFVLLDLAAMTEDQIDNLRLSAISGLTLRFLQFLPRCSIEEFPARVRGWGQLVRDTLTHPRGRDVLRALISWFLGNARANHEQIRTIMSKTTEEDAPVRTMLDEILAIGAARGREEGRVEGRLTGLHQLFRSLLTTRFGPLDQATTTRVAGADAASIDRWSQRLLTASRLEDVFGED
jgi:hypothetical protein